MVWKGGARFIHEGTYHHPNPPFTAWVSKQVKLKAEALIKTNKHLPPAAICAGNTASGVGLIDLDPL